jgi:hypothetical protein
MRIVLTLALATILIAGCQRTSEAPPPTAVATHEAESYSPFPIGLEDEPGSPRQVLCQVGSGEEHVCTTTPVFGDDSFQLDGPNIALRMVVTGNEGGLFEVFSAENRVPVVGTYRRSSPTDPCWVSDGAGPSPICIRD